MAGNWNDHRNIKTGIPRALDLFISLKDEIATGCVEAPALAVPKTGVLPVSEGKKANRGTQTVPPDAAVRVSAAHPAFPPEP